MIKHQFTRLSRSENSSRCVSFNKQQITVDSLRNSMSSNQQNRYVCNIDNCSDSFASLRLFEAHIASHYEKTVQSKKSTDKVLQKSNSVSDNNNDDLKKDSNNKRSYCDEDLEEEDYDIIDGLLKLSETNSVNIDDRHDHEPANKSVSQTTEKTVTSDVSVQIISIQDIDTKQKIVNKNVLMSPRAKFIPMIADRQTSNVNKTVSNLNMQQTSLKLSNNCKSNQTSKPRRSKKRKLSEMNSDELAHLYMQVQDRMSTLQSKLDSVKKQENAIRELYRKRARTSVSVSRSSTSF